MATLAESVVPALSLIVITKNEERCIERCLRSVDFADDIVVVDSGSTDRTVALAEACGARVLHTTDWPGFGPQKNRALHEARGDWVLALDADEWLDVETANQVKAAISARRYDAYRLPRRSRFCGRVVRHCGWSPDYVVRLFRRGSGRFTDDLVHERLDVGGPIGTLSSPIDHDAIESWADAEDKIARYAKAGAEQMAARGRRGSALQTVLHSWGAFLKTFVWRAGFLDGATGWHVAQYNRRYTQAKWRLLEAYSSKAKPPNPE